MGIFSAVIEELEDALNGVLKQVDVTDLARTAVEQIMNSVVGQSWQGQGAEAFKAECSEFVVDKMVEILGFSTDFTGGVRKVIEFLKELDEALSNPIGFIASAFGL